MQSSRIAAPNASARCDLVGDVGVVHDERMQIAVAGVEDVRAAQPVLLRQLLDPPQHRAERLARNRAVHAVVIGRDAADRRKRRLAARPQQQPLALVLRHADPGRARLAQHAGDLRHVRGDFLRRAVGLDEQHRRGVERIARRGRTPRPRASRSRSIISSPAGTMPAPMTAATAAPAAPTSSKAASATCAACGLGVSLTVISVMTASSPSEP